MKANNPPAKIRIIPMLNWTRSSPQQKESYANNLDTLLSQGFNSTSDFIQCENVLCQLGNHWFEINHLTRDLLGAVTDSTMTTKGTTGDQVSRAHTISGWHDLVKPYQGEARFWFSHWLSAGKRIHSSLPGVEHDLYPYMKSSRNQYHYAARRAQNSLKKIENDILLSKMNSPEIFEEI